MILASEYSKNQQRYLVDEPSASGNGQKAVGTTHQVQTIETYAQGNRCNRGKTELPSLVLSRLTYLFMFGIGYKNKNLISKQDNSCCLICHFDCGRTISNNRRGDAV